MKERIEILQKQIAWQEAGIEAGFTATEKQAAWLKEAKIELENLLKTTR
jgi:phosphoribosyl-dephospho-CoA transferase